jgi:ribosomal protein S18 acetylase RimI-like enzyme
MKTEKQIKVRKLKERDCEVISQAFKNQGWDKKVEQYQRYLKEQEAGKRDVLIALIDRNFAGYLTIMWESHYPYFRENRMPEIMDLNVLKKFQRMGIASSLMDFAEKMVLKKSKTIGIGVGLYSNAIENK